MDAEFTEQLQGLVDDIQQLKEAAQGGQNQKIEINASAGVGVIGACVLLVAMFVVTSTVTAAFAIATNWRVSQMHEEQQFQDTLIDINAQKIQKLEIQE